MKTNKDFDCVEMKRAASLRIHEETKGMTRQEKLAYWKRKSEHYKTVYPQLRSLDEADSSRRP